VTDRVLIRERVLAIVASRPGHTATELARKMGVMDPRTPNRRLPELERAGLVRRGPRRLCRVTNTKAATWWPTKEKTS
jgi:DNA-binding MarR family transcriptional regulator